MSDLPRSLLGIGAESLNPGQMALRAVLTFVVAVVIIRLGHKRLFGKGTAFDLVVAIMVGSVYAASAVGLVDLIAKGYGYLTYAFIALLIIPVLTIGLWRLLRAR